MRWKTVCWMGVAALAGVGTAQGDPVGDIQSFYFVPTSQSPLVTAPFALQDGPVFVFQNTSGTSITNGVFTILDGNGVATADSFNVGTLAPGANVYVAPGLTNDGGTGHTFFRFTGSILDTSESGPNGDDVQFRFTGSQGGVSVDSGVFTPATSKLSANDGTVSSMNFLGGPGNNDGPCNNCYGPHIIATLNTVAALPEPSALVLTGSALALIFACARRRAR